MAACKEQMLQQSPFSIGLYDGYGKKSSWIIMEDDDNHAHDDDAYNSTSSTSSSIGNSTSSNRSSLSSSSDLVDDASSSPSSSGSSSHHHNGPLYELSELMAQLPIKRGLSKFFQGKSESFTSLSKVMSIEDLAKKENPYNIKRKMKACKSYAGGLDTHKPYTLPKATISKKVSRGSSSSSSSSLSFTNRRSASFSCNNKLPPLHVQKNF
ncbi:protein OXIDATIVE STRESS 3-like [Humulus lupulus]|uniref:protein OXIDATIVE STRESS 3-like n=1 Tax=Humulus lupulus TaxID=3486 RepID=UPI002B40D68D|nr:protein OXIDATIVE STRESS 3-like [Humulus lupulus]